MGILEEMAERLVRIESYLAKCGPLPATAAAELERGGGMIDQRHSDLGRRVHCAAVRRRRAEGDVDNAVIIRSGNAKRYLLSPAAYAEELQRACLTPPAPAASDDPPEDAYHRALERARSVTRRK